MMLRGTVVGLAGCTNAGKTTAANHLVELLRHQKGLCVARISQDDFFKAPEDVALVEKQGEPGTFFHNYDEPAAVDIAGLIARTRTLAAHNDVVIVEGNMLSEMTELRTLMKPMLFFSMTKRECERRRNTRTYDPADKPGFFEQIVWPAYLDHLQHTQQLQTTNQQSIAFIDGTQPLSAVLNSVARLVMTAVNDLIRIQKEAIVTADLERFVNSPSCGAISLFIGTTRDNFDGKTVVSLEYECYEGMAYSELRRIISDTRSLFPAVQRIAIVHRIGRVDIGEASVAIATSSPHRKDAIDATHHLIDTLKQSVPIFKKELYEGGGETWKKNGEYENLREHLEQPSNT